MGIRMALKKSRKTSLVEGVDVYFIKVVSNLPSCDGLGVAKEYFMVKQ